MSSQDPRSDIPPVPDGLPDPRLSENAEVVLRRRYLARDSDGTIIETPRELLWRVAWTVSRSELPHGGDADATARAFYGAMARLEFLPNSPTLMNAGRPLGQLAACFVLPIEDDLAGIFETLKQAALVHKSGGGTGFDFSKIRPQGDRVRSTAGIASGPLSFLRIYNAATEEIKQGGTRRGANMGMLRVDHPDILDFIASKKDRSLLTNFNISVSATEDFMAAVEQGSRYDLINPRTGATTGHLDAREVFRKIAESAWDSAEPGLFFVDRANDRNPMKNAETIHCSNPCGEQNLAPYDSCTLGSIDLAKHVTERDGTAAVDHDKLEKTVRLAVRFLDDVLDACVYPLEEIRAKTLSNRRIGLGVMGFARLLYRLGVPYDTEAARQVAEETMAFIDRIAHDESGRLATSRGTFPAWEESTWAEKGRPMRNAACTTVAPTGTLSMIADTSGGCEPDYSLVYTKRCLDGTNLPYVVAELVDAAKEEGFWDEDLLERIRENGGSVDALDGVPERVQRIFRTAHDIAAKDHVLMQAAFQRHVDNAVSKTINLPRTATVEDVEAAYRLAYESGCVGITVYREGSRPDQVLSLGTKQDDQDPPTGTFPEDYACATCEVVPPHGHGRQGQVGERQGRPRSTTASLARPKEGAEHPVEKGTQGARAGGAFPLPVPDGTRPRPRPVVAQGMTHRIDTACGELTVTINEDDQGPAEILATLGRANAHTNAHIEATTRMASLALRCGVAVEEVVRSLKGIRCSEPRLTRAGVVHGCADAIAQALERQVLGPDGPQHEVIGQVPLDRFAAEAHARLRDER
ncbi:MAG: adenosylcobalamin-dependent ribonucleoside-diphosphate reductase [Euryarchaeota archaeon]|nr:adenosylcobalamin-dependent ribonucleoside-diphosphate reductase [Euryarchaeota archaeon]